GPGVTAVDTGQVARRRELEALPEWHALEPVEKALDPERLLDVRLDRVPLRLDRLALGLGRLPDGLVEARHEDTAVLVANRPERVEKPPTGARHDAGHTGVTVRVEDARVEAEVENALAAERDQRSAVAAEAGPFPEARVRLEQGGVLARKGVEVRAADLLLALDDPADPDRQLPLGLQQRPDGGQPCRDLPLVVRRAPGVEPSVSNRRLEWRRFPQLERVDGLDVVVVVEQDGVHAPAAALAVDGRRCALDLEPERLEPEL